MKKAILFILFQICSFSLFAQINTDRVLAIGRNALYFEDYVLSIQYFNQVIKSKPWLAEPYFYRAVAKINLDDYKGAEEDCSLCLGHNPFLVQAYYARGIARQSQEKYKEAIADYDKGLEFRPEDQQMLSNKAVACIQSKDYRGAEKVFDVIMKLYSKDSKNYMTRGAMYAEEGDTIKALADYSKAITLDPYYAPTYGNRALLLYDKHDLKGALADLNEAIRLNTRESGYFINRGLVRYQMNDLRGAMEDYDQVINIDSHNQIARFNRALLRSQVGDDNRAIEDFDVVIEQEPDNYIAYYNRALLRFGTGNYKGSIGDFDKVLAQYPNFISGYYSRSEAKRKVHDNVGADRDYWKAFEMEQKLRKGKTLSNANATASAGRNTTTVDSPDVASSDSNTREKSDKSIEKFNRLVVYDKDEERKSKYQNEFRGRVQDRNVRVDLESQFILTYYEKIDPIKELVYYDKSVEDYNARMLLSHKLRITNQEAPLTEDQVSQHFTSINELSAKIDKQPNNADFYFARGLDYMLVQDFTEAIKDYSKAIEINPNFTMAYFNRAVVRYKQLDYNLSQTAAADENAMSAGMSLNFEKGIATSNKAVSSDPITAQLKDNKRAYEHELITHDYDMVIKLNSGFVYAYFNRANLRCVQRDFRAAISDYNEAIERDPEFAEAYFNRGLAYLSQGDANKGIADLSKAGELGIVNAYSIIKRMTSN